MNGMPVIKESFLEAMQDEKDFWRGRGETVTNGIRVVLLELLWMPWKFLSGLFPFLLSALQCPS